MTGARPTITAFDKLPPLGLNSSAPITQAAQISESKIHNLYSIAPILTFATTEKK